MSAKSHKEFGANKRNCYILRKYYSSRSFLFTLCLLSEAFIVLLYLRAKSIGIQDTMYPQLDRSLGTYDLMALFTFPFWILKQAINAIQLLSACTAIAKT